MKAITLIFDGDVIKTIGTETLEEKEIISLVKWSSGFAVKSHVNLIALLDAQSELEEPLGRARDYVDFQASMEAMSEGDVNV